MNRRLDGNKWIAEILCIAFVLAGVGLFLHGLVELNRASRSPDWPSVKGTVVRSTSEGGTPYVTYTYEFDGQTFSGSHVTFGQKKIGSDSGDAQQVVRQYPKGKTVDVYYDPNDLEISVLEPGIRPGTYQEPAFGLFFMLVNGGLLFWFRRRRRRSDAPSVRSSNS